jgi:hypothetical protein
MLNLRELSLIAIAPIKLNVDAREFRPSCPTCPLQDARWSCTLAPEVAGYIKEFFEGEEHREAATADASRSDSLQGRRPKTEEERFAEFREQFDSLDDWMHRLLKYLYNAGEIYEAGAERWVLETCKVSAERPFAEINRRTGWLICRQQAGKDIYSIAARFQPDLKKLLGV